MREMNAKSKANWKFPKANVAADFVFMSVDVIGHTQLLADVIRRDDFEFVEFDKMLSHLPEMIQAQISDYDKKLRWYWAGDGGIYAFPIVLDGFDIYEFVIRCAEDILRALPKFNTKHHFPGAHAIKLRITADKGNALYRQEASFRRSLALNIAAKLKVEDDESSIAITSNFYRQFQPHSSRRSLFVPIRRLGIESSLDPTYIHAEFSKESLQNKIDRHLAARQMVFAAHCEYRRFAIDFSRGEETLAIQSITRAITYIDQETPGQHYLATLRQFYKGWHAIVEASLEGRLTHTADRGDRLVFLSDPIVADFLTASTPPLLAMLMPALEYIHEQLELLVRYVDAPRSLSVLDLLGILLRAGFSPLLKQEAVSRALDRLVTELETNNWSVDDECSLCTSRALSALALAKRAQGVASHVTAWFLTLKKYRYCYLGGNYTGAASDHHAMHYATSVAQSLMDCQCSDNLIDDVVATCFPDKTMSSDDLLDYWLKWRSESEFLVGSYIFATFLWMKQHPEYSRVIAPHLATVRDASDLYISFLNNEASRAKVEQESYLYAYRENLAALIIGNEDARSTDLIEEITHLILRKIARLVERDRNDRMHGELRPRRQSTFDSSIDRTVRFIDSWFRYFEAQLASSNSPP
jgi:hypothetical protein